MERLQGLTGWNPFYWKLSEEIVPIIKVIFERSLQAGQLPAGRVKANVMPIFKKGDRSPANYHPVFLTCILCKVLENVLASNIVKHLLKEGVLYGLALQHGLREKRSCET